jgi:hypothetical protein
VVVLGFPSQHMALCFEWAWQHPYTSRRTRSALHRLKKAKLLSGTKLKALGVNSLKASQAQSCVTRKLAQLRVMLANCEPFCCQALTIGYANHEYASLIGAHEELLNLPRLPDHMKVHVGAGRSLLTTIHARQRIASEVESRRRDAVCVVCCEPILASVDEGKRVSFAPIKCLDEECDMQAHAHCLAKRCPDGRLIPDKVACPRCDLSLNWPLVVRGYHESMAIVVSDVEQDANDPGEGKEDEEATRATSDVELPLSGNICVVDLDDDDDDGDDDDDDGDDDVESVAGSVAESVVLRRSARTNKVLSRLIPGEGTMVDVISFSSSEEDGEDDGGDGSAGFDD